MREVPSIPAGLEPKLRNVLSAVRESLNAAITNINTNADNLNGLRQWVMPALEANNNLVVFNQAQINAALESATGADGAAGIAARAVSLTTPSQSFTYDTNGANPSPASSVITATAVNTAGVVYYEFFVNDVSTGTATTTNTYTYTPQVLFDSMPDKLEVQIREDSITGPIEARDMMTMIGLRAGAHGITVMLSNEAHTLPKTTAGVVTYAGSGTNINVWEGATALTADSSSPYANSTFRVTNTPTGITPGAITGAGTTTLTYGDSSNMTTDPAKIVFTIIAKREDGTEITVTKQQSLSLSQQGATGGTGDTGGTGATGSRATFTTYATVASAAWNNATAYNAIIAMTGSGGVLLVGDEVTLCYPNTTAPTWVLTQYVTAVGNPGTWSVRGQVFDGNLMITGSLSAASLKTSNLTAANAISVVDTSNVTRVKMGNLGSSYGLQGWNNANTSVFKLDENGLDSKITQNTLNLFGCSYHNRIILEGTYVFTILGTAVQTVVLPITVSTSGMFRLKAQITGYWENDNYNTSHALWREMSMGVYYRNSTGTSISMGVVSESSDTTDATNYPASKVTLQVNATTEQPELKLVSKAGTAGINNFTYYTYIVWAIDNVAYPYDTY